MAKRSRNRHTKRSRGRKKSSLRARAMLALSLCSVSGMFGMAMLTYPNMEFALLAYASVPLAVLGEADEETALPVSANPMQTEFVLRKKQDETDPNSSRNQEQPRVLIYHTHATEAYFPSEANPYVSSGRWRTEEKEKSVIAVGALLAAMLENTYGIEVLHETTNYEPPKLSTAYSRSETMLKDYRSKYPSIELYIDVHRDAYGNDITVPTDFLKIEDREVARLMFVVGTGQGATGTGFDEMPQYESNLSLAEQITASLNGMHDRLAREVRVKTGRYNQHISDHCLLVEVGHNANTLEQALAAVPYLAEGIAQAMESMTMSEYQNPAIGIWLPDADGT